VKRLFVKYVPDIKDNELILSSELIIANNIVYRKVLLNIGYWKREFSVKYMDNWPIDVIGLSKDLSKDFVLPDSIPYKIRFEDRSIYIGPIIGLLLVTNNKTLTPEFLSIYKDYLLSYNEVKGLIFMGSSEGINTENKTIKGYFYKPDSDESWTSGVFPYPDAIYRRVGISDHKYADLIMHIGDRIFNTYFFDKWELWQCLSPYEEIKQHLPHTEKLTDTDSLVKMLEQHDSVYLKKLFGEKSLGIYRVDKLGNNYQFIDRMRNQNIISSIEELSKFLNEITQKNGPYLIQQTIKVKNFENRSFDMRVVLQKNEKKEWYCTGIIARFGGKGSIASNIGLGGLAMRGQEALKQVFNLEEEAAIMKENEIISVCKEACETLNKTIGHYGDLGIDVVIDENQKIWILEINKLHYHHYPIYALKDKQMYLDIASTPIRYAGALAGFE
jgi:hypothetical protein